MSKTDKKRRRQSAIQAEIARREADRRDRSPLSRDDMVQLLEFVGEHVMIDGHARDFSYTLQWLKDSGNDGDPALNFLREEGIYDDWSLCIEGDPYKLFGASPERIFWMPIEREQLEALIDWLDDQVAKRGCNHDMAITTEWLEKYNYPVQTTLMALLAQGGGCDCEVVLNVEPESIYP